MMGQCRFATKLYYRLSLDGLVPQDHILRRIAAAVDFFFARSPCGPFHTGQPSVDLVVLFNTLLDGRLYRITSECWLMERVGVNLARRWLLGYDPDGAILDHSVLSKARPASSGGIRAFLQRSLETVSAGSSIDRGLVCGDTHG